MATAPFELSYTMERGDFVALTQAMMRPTLRAAILRALLIIAGAAVGFVIGTGFHPAGAIEELVTLKAPLEGYVIMSVVGLVIVFLIAIARPLYLRSAAIAAYKRSAAAGQVVTLRLDNDRVFARQPGVTTTIDWSAVTCLIETPAYLFIAISRREALIVPRRAFAGDADFAGFIAWARGKAPAIDAKAPSA